MTNKPRQSQNALCHPCSGRLVHLAIYMQIEAHPPLSHTHTPSIARLSILIYFVLHCVHFILEVQVLRYVCAHVCMHV